MSWKICRACVEPVHRFVKAAEREEGLTQVVQRDTFAIRGGRLAPDLEHPVEQFQGLVESFQLDVVVGHVGGALRLTQQVPDLPPDGQGLLEALRRLVHAPAG